MRRRILICLLLFSVPVCLFLYRQTNSKSSPTQYSQVINDSPNPGSEIQVNTENAIDLLQFTSPDVGWLGSHSGELRRTTDAGSTWLNIDLGVSGFLAGMQFVSDQKGWIILDQYLNGGDKTDTRAKLLTTNDAGQSWGTLFDVTGVELVDLTVVNNHEVWILGSKFSGSGRTTVSKIFLLQSKNGGAEWSDRSEHLNSFLMKMDGGVLESAAVLFVTEPQVLILLTRNGMVLKSSDEGKNWSRLVSIDTKGLPAHKLIDHKSFPLILAGMGGNHGTASLVAIPNDDGSITTNVLGGTYLKDALFIPGKGLLACGYIQSGSPGFRREGVVFASADFGRNWNTIYRADQFETINSLAVSGNTIWAGGPRGLLIKLNVGESR